MSTRQLRTLRGVAGAFVAALIAATAHTLAGGGAPAPAFVAAIAVLTAPGAVLLVGRRLSLVRVGAVVVASQALFHVAFAIAGDAAPTTGAPSHQHGAMVFDLLVPATSATSSLIPDALMLVAHLLAAAATVLVLHRGEQVLGAVARGLTKLIRRAIVSLHSPEPVRDHAGFLPPAVPSMVARRTGVSRRGPPRVLVVS